MLHFKIEINTLVTWGRWACALTQATTKCKCRSPNKIDIEPVTTQTS